MNIPRRLCVNDADYDPSIGQQINVFVNGVLQKWVVEYDIDQNLVVEHISENNEPVFLGDNFAIIHLDGEVTVKLR